MVDRRRYILDTLAAVPEGDPILFELFCALLRWNGLTYLRYRVARIRHDDQQGLLFDDKNRSDGPRT